MDVGLGTEDVLLYNSSYEDYSKLVLPAPTQAFSRKIRSLDRGIHLTGGTIGGGPISQAVKTHLLVALTAQPEPTSGLYRLVAYRFFHRFEWTIKSNNTTQSSGYFANACSEPNAQNVQPR